MSKEQYRAKKGQLDEEMNPWDSYGAPENIDYNDIVRSLTLP